MNHTGKIYKSFIKVSFVQGVPINMGVQGGYVEHLTVSLNPNYFYSTMYDSKNFKMMMHGTSLKSKKKTLK